MIATRELLLSRIKYTRFTSLIIFFFSTIICYSIKANTTPIGERKIEINQNWKFTIDPNNEGEDSHWYNSNYNVVGWKNVSIPHNWDLDNEYANYKGKSWYRTAFETPTLLVKKNDGILVNHALNLLQIPKAGVRLPYCCYTE